MGYYTETTHPQIKKYEAARTGATRYLVRYRTDQGRLTMKRGFTTMRDAKAFLADVETSKATGTFVSQSAGAATIGELADPWLAHKAAVQSRSYADALDASWRTHVRDRWADVAVSRVQTSAVRDWVAELATTRSATTVARAYGILAGILDDAVADQRLARNPARGVKLPRSGSKTRRYLTAAEVEALADAVGERWRPVLHVLAWTGLRWGEMAALRIRDVNFLRGRLLVQRAVVKVKGDWVVTDTKGHQRRSVPVPASVLEELRELVAKLSGAGPDRLLFPPARSEDGYLYPPRKSAERPDRPGKVRTDWLEAGLAEIGAEYLSPHDLRHTAASLAVSAGANVKALQRMLGHASASLTLDTYADLFDADLDDVAERLDASRKAALTVLRGPAVATGS